MTKPKAVLTLNELRGKAPCRAGQVISMMSAEDQATINEALAGHEDEFPSGRVVRALAGLGIAIAKDTIIKHRRGFCACKSL